MEVLNLILKFLFFVCLSTIGCFVKLTMEGRERETNKKLELDLFIQTLIIEHRHGILARADRFLLYTGVASRR